MPPGWGGEPGVNYGDGLPVYGYQFQYGSFAVHPGSPPKAEGMFALTTQEFPQGASQKLYHEKLQYVGFNAGGPLQGAIFLCTIKGKVRHFLFGTTSLGTQNGIELRNIRYFDEGGADVFNVGPLLRTVGR